MLLLNVVVASHHDKCFLPFAKRLASIARPLLVFNRAINPDRLFCTLLEGLNVLRGAPTAADAEKCRVDATQNTGTGLKVDDRDMEENADISPVGRDDA